MRGHAKNQLLDRGVPAEQALYLLPNAKSIRLIETGSLLHLLHKWTMRTCFNAQEEIYQSSMDELAQLREVHPEIARYVGPPCYLRANITTPDLHRRLPLLRHQSLAGLPQRDPPYLAPRNATR